MTEPGRGLTGRGRAVLVSAAVLATAGYLFGVQELYSLALGAAVLVLAARVWVQLRRWDLAVSRRVHPPRVRAGYEARVELTIANRSNRRSPLLEANDAFDGGRRWARFSVAPLGPDETLSSSYLLPTAQRGVHHLGPLLLRVGDPLGLAHETRSTAPDTSLTVHPRYELVPVRSVSSHRDSDRRRARPLIGRGATEFYMLREYVPGDDLRRVHWPSTARTGDLVIRQPETTHRGRLTVIADLRSTVCDPDSLESVVSASASVAVSSLHDGLQVRLVTTGGFDSGHSSSPASAPALLDGLSAAQMHPPVAGVPPFRGAGRLDPIVLVTTDRCSQTDLESAYELGGSSATTIVMFESPAGPDPIAAADGSRRAGRAVRVPAGKSFAASWTSWEQASC